MPQAIVGMELGDIQSALGADLPGFRARQIYDAVYRQRVADLGAISNLPKPLRRRLAGEFPVGLPEIARRYDSVDGTVRYLLKLADGKTVETVWMPESKARGFIKTNATKTDGRSLDFARDDKTDDADRATVCISSQVGCPVDCKFCLTAKLGLERNLTAGEIVGQVLLAAGTAPVDRLNIVMMGQGEPLLNLPNVIKATRLLTDPEGIGISPRRITLSTSGIVPKIVELGREPVRPKLAISLNASTEEQRRALMPVTRKYHLKELIDACKAYPLRPWEKLTFEYVLLKGVNDSDADARRVVRWLANLDAKVNLIALNPGPGILFETPERERVSSFQTIVRKSMPCFVRKPRGLDVFAACGQLKRMELTQIQPQPEIHESVVRKES
ncbi:MAG TPA: 23S rRNA (adenine(2503)-C(2))-methyltransferase RlmN [Bryobacteraceae bacterium]|nr:23S rRNA (adenine(2503)-C(2))-methyltransferase RlmN [Bryobacteraceae bacterium]